MDDASTRDYLFDPFEKYIQMLPKVRIMRNVKRNGLIRSRLAGFDEATGDVVVFLVSGKVTFIIVPVKVMSVSHNRFA